MKNTDKPETPPSNSFMAVLQQKELKDGFLSDASVELEKAALAAVRTGKKSVVTVTLTIDPQKGSAISVGATLNSKVPQTKEDSLTIFYVDNEGGLKRNDPRQREFGPILAANESQDAEQPAEAAQAAS